MSAVTPSRPLDPTISFREILKNTKSDQLKDLYPRALLTCQKIANQPKLNWLDNFGVKALPSMLEGKKWSSPTVLVYRITLFFHSIINALYWKEEAVTADNVVSAFHPASKSTEPTSNPTVVSKTPLIDPKPKDATPKVGPRQPEPQKEPTPSKTSVGNTATKEEFVKHKITSEELIYKGPTVEDVTDKEEDKKTGDEKSFEIKSVFPHDTTTPLDQLLKAEDNTEVQEEPKEEKAGIEAKGNDAQEDKDVNSAPTPSAEETNEQINKTFERIDAIVVPLATSTEDLDESVAAAKIEEEMRASIAAKAQEEPKVEQTVVENKEEKPSMVTQLRSSVPASPLATEALLNPDVETKTEEIVGIDPILLSMANADAVNQ